MVKVLGLDLAPGFEAIKDQMGEMFSRFGNDLSSLDSGQRDNGQPANPFELAKYGGALGSPYYGLSYGTGTDFAAQTSQQSLFNRAFSAHDQWQGALAKKAAEEAAAAGHTGQQQPGYGGATGGGTGGGWTGPATGADNAALTPEQVERVIAQTRGNSPLVGKGAWLLQQANARNISLPLFMGIMLAESELGTTAGPGWGALVGLGGAGGLRQYGSLEEAVTAGMDNLAGDTYRGKSLQDQVGIWFTGKPGLAGTDGVNGTTGDYIGGKVAPMYAAFGVPFQQAQPPTRQQAPAQPGGGAGVTPGGYAFPVVGWAGSIETHHGTGETGASDIMAPAGATIVAMRGGQVIDASYNTLGGNTVTILGDDGLTYYYAHMQAPALVAAGTRIQTGAGLGYVGNTGNAANTPSHLHLGIGRGIQSGDGPQGGAGYSWGPGPHDNAVGLLQWVYSGGH